MVKIIVGLLFILLSVSASAEPKVRYVGLERYTCTDFGHSHPDA